MKNEKLCQVGERWRLFLGEPLLGIVKGVPVSLLLTNRGISTKHQHTVFTFGDALRCRPVCGARNSPKFRNRRKECSSRIRRKRPEEESLSYKNFETPFYFSTSEVVSPRIIKSPISSTLLDTRKLSTCYTREYSESQSRNEKKKKFHSPQINHD